jgi:hypothetical protein
VVTNQWVSPDVGADAFGVFAEQWLPTKAHRKLKKLAGHRGLLDAVILPRWAETPLKAIAYADLSVRLSGLSLSGSRITQAHRPSVPYLSTPSKPAWPQRIPPVR